MSPDITQLPISRRALDLARPALTALTLLSATMFASAAAVPAYHAWAATPPMGWNSWDAFGTTLNETKATGYPNDLPVTDYDFGAPLGACGQVVFLTRRLAPGLCRGPAGADAQCADREILPGEGGGRAFRRAGGIAAILPALRAHSG